MVNNAGVGGEDTVKARSLNIDVNLVGFFMRHTVENFKSAFYK